MHSCRRFAWPSSNTEYWVPKIKRNAERDKRNYAELNSLGWHVIVVWECELKKKSFEETMMRVISEIVSS